MAAPRRTRRGRKGFSLVELLVVVLVTSMGFVALFGMQIGTLRGLAQTRHLVQASNLGQNFMAYVRLELMRWTENVGEGLGELDFPSLAGLPTDAAAAPGSMSSSGDVQDAEGWVIAGPDGDDRRVSVMGHEMVVGDTVLNEGALEAMVDPGMEDVQKPYCLLYRLTWMIPGRLVRVEVEVQWPLDVADMVEFVKCDQLASQQLDQARSINLNTTVAVNLFQR